MAIENLGKNHQNIVRLLKAGGRLFERPIMGQDLGKERKEAAHFLYKERRDRPVRGDLLTTLTGMGT